MISGHRTKKLLSMGFEILGLASSWISPREIAKMLLMAFNICFLCIPFVVKIECMDTWHYWCHNSNILLRKFLCSDCANCIGWYFYWLKATNTVCQNIAMELTSQYTSNSLSESSNKNLEAAQVWSVYLLTNSKVDLRIFPDRKSFADAVCEEVRNCEGPKAKFVQWSCCQESHKKGGGKYFHMAVKLNFIKRWLPIQNYLKNKWSLYVHFSNRHINYYTAWLYTTEESLFQAFR